MIGYRKYQFTLIEIVIAVSIFTLVALSLFMYSSGVTGTWGRITKHRNNLSELLLLDRTISAVISNMIPFLWREADDFDETYPFIVAESNRLRCAYFHKLNDLDEGAIRFCEFFVEDGILYVQYADRPFKDWNEVDERATKTALSENVEELHFLYVDWNDDIDSAWSDRMIWRDEWETEDSGREDIPLAVLMTVRWQDGTMENWMYRTMGNGYRERHGAWEALGENESRKL